jgi:hypothetical protein
MSAANIEDLTHVRLAKELIRALRGRRSCAELSRRLGYRSNVVRRWESGVSFPSAVAFFQAHKTLTPRTVSSFEQFFGRRPPWYHGTIDAHVLAAFLRDVKGRTSTADLAKSAGFNRYSVGRWLSAKANPNLPEFIALVDAASRRLIDWVATIVEPTRIPSLANKWTQLQLARKAAYSEPWSHAVLRALELEELPKRSSLQIPWLAERLGIAGERVEAALQILIDAGQVRLVSGRYRLDESLVIETSRDPVRARALKVTWAKVATERLGAGAAGNFGYSLFAVSKEDLVALRELHLQYVRQMQQIIARSTPNQCVGLYCSQLLDLSTVDNALADRQI